MRGAARRIPVNTDWLLTQAEAERIEFKAGWDDKVTPEQVLHTLTAFANDYANLNGGYLIVGCEERGGRALIPPRGIQAGHADTIRKKIFGLCRRADPELHPTIEVREYQGRDLIIVWMPASQQRPHNAPVDSNHGRSKERAYYIRIGSETRIAVGQQLRELHAQSIHPPFDARRAHTRSPEDIESQLVREHLNRLKSKLLDEAQPLELLRSMRAIERVNGHEEPTNWALLFFTRRPHEIFPGASIRIVEKADEGGRVIDERLVEGPLLAQADATLQYLNQRIERRTRKSPAGGQATSYFSYPADALREAVINAIYHRSYEAHVSEPTRVDIFRDRIEITSYPGPVAGLKEEHFKPGGNLPPVPARNQKIGEILREVSLAEQRSTGIRSIHRAMSDNGSPEAQIDFAESYFRITLPIHNDFKPKKVQLVRLLIEVDSPIVDSDPIDSEVETVRWGGAPEGQMGAALRQLPIDGEAWRKALGAMARAVEVACRRDVATIQVVISANHGVATFLGQELAHRAHLLKIVYSSWDRWSSSWVAVGLPVDSVEKTPLLTFNAGGVSEHGPGSTTVLIVVEGIRPIVDEVLRPVLDRIRPALVHRVALAQPLRFLDEDSGAVARGELQEIMLQVIRTSPSAVADLHVVSSGPAWMSAEIGRLATGPHFRFVIPYLYSPERGYVSVDLRELLAEEG